MADLYAQRVARVTETFERAKQLRLLLKSHETYVTEFVTPYRLKSLAWAYGDQLDKMMAAHCETLDEQCQFIDALCASFGPIRPLTPRPPRADRGSRHMVPFRAWKTRCQHCGRDSQKTRWDAQYCSNACRQAAYRARTKR